MTSIKVQNWPWELHTDRVHWSCCCWQDQAPHYLSHLCTQGLNIFPALHPQGSLLPYFTWKATHQRGSRHLPTLFLSKHTGNCHKHGWPTSMNPTELPRGSVTSGSCILQCKLLWIITEFPKSCSALGCSSEN